VLRIHTKDGRTRSLDLSDAEQAREWLRLSGDARFQASVSGVTIASGHRSVAECAECGACSDERLTIQYSVARPQDFRRVEVLVEDVPRAEGVNGGERVIVFADDVRLTLMAHAANPAARVVLSKVGHRRFDPKRA
jgi:hypothetical protein